MSSYPKAGAFDVVGINRKQILRPFFFAHTDTNVSKRIATCFRDVSHLVGSVLDLKAISTEWKTGWGMPCTQCARSAKFWMSANT